jgi:polyadenylate-binding protein
VRNLAKEVTQKDVRAAFEKFGSILSCKVELFNDGTSKGFAYIQFDKPE